MTAVHIIAAILATAGAIATPSRIAAGGLYVLAVLNLWAGVLA